MSLHHLKRDQEVMGALFLDRRDRLMSEREMFRGTLDRTAVEPRAVLRESLPRDGVGVILWHTYPSGDPAPSDEDLLFTRRMALAGETVGVEPIDHLVIGLAGSWVSIREKSDW